MEFLNVLSREEMRNVTGGGSCGIYSNGEWLCGWSVEDAQSWFNNHPDVTGYCCSSCGETGFLGSVLKFLKPTIT